MNTQSASGLTEASLAVAEYGSCPNAHLSGLQYVASYLSPPPSSKWSLKYPGHCESRKLKWGHPAVEWAFRPQRGYRESFENRGRDLNDITTSQGTLHINSYLQSLGRSKGIIHRIRELRPVHASRTMEKHVLSAAWFVAFCYRTTIKLAQIFIL